MTGAFVVPVLGAGWVRNGYLFLSFRCRLSGHRVLGRESGWLPGHWRNSLSICSLDTFLLLFIDRIFR